MFNYLLIVFSIFSMAFFWPNTVNYAPQEMFFQYGVMALFGISLFSNKMRNSSNLTLGLLFLYVLAQTVLLNFTPVSRMYLCNIFLGLVGVKIISEYHQIDFKRFGVWFYVFAMANMFWVLVQVFDRDPIFTNIFANNMPQIDHVGFMGARFCLSLMVALITPFIYRVNKWLPLTLIPLFYFGKSSTCIGAFVLSYGFLFISDIISKIKFYNENLNRTLKTLIIVIPILIGIIAVLGYSIFIDAPTGQFSKRLLCWSACISILKSNMWFGLGGGVWSTLNVATMQQNGIPEVWKWVHNDPLQFIFSYGIIGSLFLFAYVKDFIKKVNFRNLDHRTIFALFIALGVTSLFHFPFHARFPGVVILILGLMESIKRES